MTARSLQRSMRGSSPVRGPVVVAGGVLIVVLVAVVGCTSSPPLARESLVDALAQLEQMQARAEIAIDEAVAVCMRTAGFDYVPTTPVSPPPMSSDGVDSHEFRERYGYGISTITGVDPPEPSDDPNGAYLAGLDASANEAYLDAMFGPVGEDPPGGCFNDSRRQVIGPFDRFMAAHATELTELWDAIDRDPAVVEAETAWSRCMAREGIDAVDPRAVRDELSARLGMLDPGDSAALAALQAEERADALIDERCAAAELDAVSESVLAAQRARLEGSGSSLFSDLTSLTSDSN